MWCLEHKYEKRPKFKHLREVVLRERSTHLKYKSDFVLDPNKKFPSVSQKPIKKVVKKPKAKVFSLRDFGIQSNIEFKREKSMKEIPQIQNFNFKKKEPEESFVEDFVIEPVETEETEDLEESEKSKERSLEQINGFNNDYSTEKKPNFSKFRYKQKIFDESQDVYYREIKKEGFINYKSVRSVANGKQEEELFGNGVHINGHPLQARFIKSSHE